MKIILDLIFLYFSVWSRLLRFLMFLGLMPWNGNEEPTEEEENATEPAPTQPKKPVYIEIIEECVEKLPGVLRAVVEEMLKKVCPSFLQERTLPEEEDHVQEADTSSSDVIIVPEKTILPTPSQIFWSFHKDKAWINELYRSTSGSTFLTANEASLYIQEYYQSEKNHCLLIFHFEKVIEPSGKILSEHKALDGSLVKFTTLYEYLCISLPVDQRHVFYDTFDLDIFQPSQLKCLATPIGIELDCKRGLEKLSELKKEAEKKRKLKTSIDLKVEEVFEEPQAEVSVEAKEYNDIGAKRNFDAMVTSTESIESCSSSNQEFKEARTGFRKRRNRKKSNPSPVVEKSEKNVIQNEFA